MLQVLELDYKPVDEEEIAESIAQKALRTLEETEEGKPLAEAITRLHPTVLVVQSENKKLPVSTFIFLGYPKDTKPEIQVQSDNAKVTLVNTLGAKDFTNIQKDSISISPYTDSVYIHIRRSTATTGDSPKTAIITHNAHEQLITHKENFAHPQNALFIGFDPNLAESLMHKLNIRHWPDEVLVVQEIEPPQAPR